MNIAYHSTICGDNTSSPSNKCLPVSLLIEKLQNNELVKQNNPEDITNDGDISTSITSVTSVYNHVNPSSCNEMAVTALTVEDSIEVDTLSPTHEQGHAHEVLSKNNTKAVDSPSSHHRSTKKLHRMSSVAKLLSMNMLPSIPSQDIQHQIIKVLDEAPYFHIPRCDVKLQEKSFAKGGGGQIFKGKYSGLTIAAKEVFAPDMGVGNIPSSPTGNGGSAGSAGNRRRRSGEFHVVSEARLEFDKEVDMLTKLSHPYVTTLFGVSENKDGNVLLCVCCVFPSHVSSRSSHFPSHLTPYPLPINRFVHHHGVLSGRRPVFLLEEGNFQHLRVRAVFL